MRLVVAIFSVVLAVNTCALATAQDAQKSEAFVWPSGPPKDRALSSEESLEKASGDQPDSLTRALSQDVSDVTPWSPQEMQPAVPLLDPQWNSFGSDCCLSCNNPCPCVYFQIEALFLLRSPRFANQPIVVDPNTGTTFLSTSDLNSMFNPGMRATVGMRICGGRAIELSYFGLFQGNTSAVAVRPDPTAFLTFPDNLFGNVFVDMARVQVAYSSMLNGFEANLPCCCGCCDECCNECDCDSCRVKNNFGNVRCQSVEWFTGFRYLNVNENLNIAAQRDVAGGVEDGSYRIRTNNDLYGGQFGARIRRTKGRLGWEATGKAGVFANDAQQTQSVTDFPDFALRPTASSRATRVAFIGELNLSGLYRLTDIWNLRAGYSAIWIEGLALAPDQLDFNFATAPSGNQLHNNGGLLLHGVSVGVEARW